MAHHSADGSLSHPYSALHLRLVLALFGLGSFLVLLFVSWWVLHLVGLAAFSFALALIALANVLIVERRLHQKDQRDPEK